MILGDQGVINSFLFWTGLRDEDDPVAWLLYSQFAVILTLIYVYVPFVALPDLRLARVARPPPARGGLRPGGEPLAGLPQGDAARSRCPA